MKDFADKFNELFNRLGNAEQVTIFNEWAWETYNEPIYHMEEFNEIMAGFEPMDIALKIRFGRFDNMHDYFTFNGYANLESIENVAEFIDDYVYDMGNYFEEYEDRLAELAGTAWEEICEEETI